MAIHRPVGLTNDRELADAAFCDARANQSDALGPIRYRLMSAAAYPDGFDVTFDRMGNGDAVAIDDMISWLESDPFCLTTGWAKQKTMRALATQKLSTRQAERVRQLVIAVLHRGRRMEFRDTCRLARAVRSEALLEALDELAATCDAPDVRERAALMAQRCRAE